MVAKQIRHDAFLGFSTLKEVIEVTFGLRNRIMFLIESTVASMGLLSAFIDSYIFSPYQQLYTLLAFLIIDYITGVMVAIKVRKEGFSTRKGQRIVFLFLSYTGAMFGAFWLSKSGQGYFFMPYIVFYYLSSVVVLSSFKNAAMLGLLPKGITELLTRYVDAHKEELVEVLKQANNDNKNKQDEKN